MYEDNTRNSINWMPILTKGGIALVVIILLLIIINLFSNFDSSTSTEIYIADNYEYRNNLSEMKTTAFEYFTSDLLPEKVGDSVTLTLSQMISQKLLIDFTDNGSTCNLTNSYVKVTKTNDYNYALKVQLDCDNTVDYIVTSIEEEEDCTVNCIYEDEDDVEEEDSSSNSSSSSDSSSSNSTNSSTSTSDSTSNSGSSSGSTSYDVYVNNNIYNFTTSVPCENCTDEEDDVEEEDVEEEEDTDEEVTTSKTYSYKVCKYESNTYYTTSYVTINTSENYTYTYTLQVNDLTGVDAKDISIEADYFSSGTTDYSKYISTRDEYLEMIGNTGENNVYFTSSTKFKNSSLTSDNFKFWVGDVYEYNNKYYVQIKIYYMDADDVDMYYSSEIGNYVYFVPVKFTITYYDKDDCYSKTTSETVYNWYIDLDETYYVYNVKVY